MIDLPLEVLLAVSWAEVYQTQTERQTQDG